MKAEPIGNAARGRIRVSRLDFSAMLLHYPVAVLLFATGIPKVSDALQRPGLAVAYDGLLQIRLSVLYLVVGLIEISIGVMLPLLTSYKVRCIIIGMTGYSFLTYRVVRYLFSINEPCPCLGSFFTQRLHVAQATVDFALITLALYMICGSAICWCGRQRHASKT